MFPRLSSNSGMKKQLPKSIPRNQGMPQMMVTQQLCHYPCYAKIIYDCFKINVIKLFRPFGFIALKHYYIIWLSILSILSVPDEGYSRNASCAPKLMSTFLLHLLIRTHLTKLNQMWPLLYPFSICVWQPRPPFKIAVVTRNIISWYDYYWFILSQNELKFNCICMTMSSST